MDTLLGQLVNGLTAGANYAVVAAGLALLFGVLEIVNFAHGEFYMLGAYLLYMNESVFGMRYVLASLVALIGMAIFGVVFYYVVVLPVLNRGWQAQIVATLAVSILMVNLTIVVAGSLPKNVQSDGMNAALVRLGAIQVSQQRLLILSVTAITFVALSWFLKRTKMGTSMRALAQNREAAAVGGIPVERVGLVAVVIASVLAGIAAVTVTPLYSAKPTMGALIVL